MRNATQKKEECRFMIGALTQAMQAQRVLLNGAIKSEVVGADLRQGSAGCGYGVTYPCGEEIQARNLLRKAGIRVRR